MARARPGARVAWLRNEVKNGDRSRCWVFPFKLTRQGYGRVVVDGRTWFAHRFACVLDGRDPDGFISCHLCDNKSCCNPDHIQLADSAENSRQAKERGLIWSKLNRVEVIEIRIRLKRGESAPRIAADYDVTPECIHGIKHGRSWKHVTL